MNLVGEIPLRGGIGLQHPLFAIIRFCQIRSALGCISCHSILAFFEFPLESRNSLPNFFVLQNSLKYTSLHF
jgi:hypothetical protein